MKRNWLNTITGVHMRRLATRELSERGSVVRIDGRTDGGGPDQVQKRYKVHLQIVVRQTFCADSRSQLAAVDHPVETISGFWITSPTSGVRTSSQAIAISSRYSVLQFA